MFVTMTMIQTPWSQTVRQKSPNVLATGPEMYVEDVIRNCQRGAEWQKRGGGWVRELSRTPYVALWSRAVVES